jgi:hypothetical protein
MCRRIGPYSQGMRAIAVRNEGFRILAHAGGRPKRSSEGVIVSQASAINTTNPAWGQIMMLLVLRVPRDSAGPVVYHA